MVVLVLAENFSDAVDFVPNYIKLKYKIWTKLVTFLPYPRSKPSFLNYKN